MSKTAEPDDITALVNGEPEEREDASARAARCAAEIRAVLSKHRCAILPRIEPDGIEPVGHAGNKVQITATYGVFPLA